MKSAPRDSRQHTRKPPPADFVLRAPPPTNYRSVYMYLTRVDSLIDIDVLRGRHGSNKARKRIYIKYCRVAALRVRQNIAFLYTLSIGCRCVICGAPRSGVDVALA